MAVVCALLALALTLLPPTLILLTLSLVSMSFNTQNVIDAENGSCKGTFHVSGPQSSREMLALYVSLFSTNSDLPIRMPEPAVLTHGAGDSQAFQSLFQQRRYDGGKTSFYGKLPLDGIRISPDAGENEGGSSATPIDRFQFHTGVSVEINAKELLQLVSAEDLSNFPISGKAPREKFTVSFKAMASTGDMKWATNVVTTANIYKGNQVENMGKIADCIVEALGIQRNDFHITRHIRNYSMDKDSVKPGEKEKVLEYGGDSQGKVWVFDFHANATAADSLRAFFSPLKPTVLQSFDGEIFMGCVSEKDHALANVDYKKFKAQKSEDRYDLKVRIRNKALRVKKVNKHKQDLQGNDAVFTSDDRDSLNEIFTCAMQTSEDGKVITMYNMFDENFVHHALSSQSISDQLLPSGSNGYRVHKMQDPIPEHECEWQKRIWLKYNDSLPQREGVARYAGRGPKAKASMSDAYKQLIAAAKEKKKEKSRTPKKSFRGPSDRDHQNLRRENFSAPREHERESTAHGGSSYRYEAGASQQGDGGGAYTYDPPPPR